MSGQMQIREAYNLLLADRPDELIERLTGVTLLEILELRAGRASASPAGDGRGLSRGIPNAGR